MKIKSSKIKSSTPIKGGRKNVTVIVGLAIAIIIVCASVFFGLSSLFKTSTYYVLRSDVPANTEITTGMLSGQTTQKGTAPQNAINIQQVQTGKLYSKYALQKGDVIAKSNVGPMTNSVSGIPDSWVVTSFSAASGDSVDGQIQKGSYFDIIGIDNSSRARYLFTDVLALNVSGGGSAQTTSGKSTASSYTYTVGMPAKDAALLQSSLKKFPTIKLVLSPKSVSYGQRDVSGLGNTVTFNGDTPGDQDLYKGTDPTFSNVKRNKKGEPVNQKGNPALKTSDSSTK